MKTPALSLAALLAAVALADPSAAQTAPAPAPDGVVARLCKTAAACRTEADRLRVQPARGASSALAREQDLFYWFGRINMASTVANVELGIIPKELPARSPAAWPSASTRPRSRAASGRRTCCRPRRSSPTPPAPRPR